MLQRAVSGQQGPLLEPRKVNLRQRRVSEFGRLLELADYGALHPSSRVALALSRFFARLIGQYPR